MEYCSFRSGRTKLATSILPLFAPKWEVGGGGVLELEAISLISIGIVSRSCNRSAAKLWHYVGQRSKVHSFQLSASMAPIDAFLYQFTEFSVNGD